MIPGPRPALLPDKPYSKETGSVLEELILYSSHDHPLFKLDSSELYGEIEVATRGTVYAATIKPFQKTRDGRGAYMALIEQFAGRDKWLVEWQKNEECLHTGVWKGNGTFTLEQFCSKHRLANEQLKLAAVYVPNPLPKKFA